MDKKADTHNKIKTLQEEAKIYRTRNSSNATSPIATKKNEPSFRISKGIGKRGCTEL